MSYHTIELDDKKVERLSQILAELDRIEREEIEKKAKGQKPKG